MAEEGLATSRIGFNAPPRRIEGLRTRTRRHILLTHNMDDSPAVARHGLPVVVNIPTTEESILSFSSLGKQYNTYSKQSDGTPKNCPPAETLTEQQIRQNARANRLA